MPVTLALFPLQLAVFPGERLKLHIFEPRYIELVSECAEGGTTFGIPAFIEGKLAEYGTEMRLVEISTRYDDGEMDVVTEGLRAFQLHSFIPKTPGRLYSSGEVTFLENDEHAYEVTRNELITQYKRLHKVLKAAEVRSDFDAENLSFVLAQEVGLTLLQKVRLLSIENEGERQLLLIEHLHRVIPLLESAGETSRRVRGNGHFLKLPKIEL